MSQSETRDLFLNHEGHDDDLADVNQRAIPWCLTHDRQANKEPLGFGENEHVISMGGPDHRWWEDIE